MLAPVLALILLSLVLWLLTLVTRIPAFVVTHPQLGLLGAATRAATS